MSGWSTFDRSDVVVGICREGTVRAEGAVAVVSGRSALDGGDVRFGFRISVTKRAGKAVDTVSGRSALHDVGVERGGAVATVNGENPLNAYVGVEFRRDIAVGARRAVATVSDRGTLDAVGVGVHRVGVEHGEAVATVNGKNPFNDDVSVGVPKGIVATLSGMSALDLVDAGVRRDDSAEAVDAVGRVSASGVLDLVTS